MLCTLQRELLKVKKEEYLETDVEVKSKISEQVNEILLVKTAYTIYIYIKTHGSVSCGPRSRRATP